MNKQRDIIVIGASAGGMESMISLLSYLPENFDASIFFIFHMGAGTSGLHLQKTLRKSSKLKCKLAHNNEVIRKAHVYIAPPDHHMLIKDNKILINYGPRENRFRPCADTLFRSAAANFNSRVTGIILSGMLDDGTAGLSIIKQCNGIAIVQDPEEATFAEMPLSALKNVAVDYCLPVKGIAEKLVELLSDPLPLETEVPHVIQQEAAISERIFGEMNDVNKIGKKAPYICPDCGGGLWEVDNAGLKHYRCHVGHTFSEAGLLRNHQENLENALWVCLRMMEERRTMLFNMAETEKSKARVSTASSFKEKADEMESHIQTIRQVLFSETK
ncbi:MAG TPA: chemotaxis protein CheB [Cytophagaceae bacterium]|jgi:two-component system chemotaxis response regulator CheB